MSAEEKAEYKRQALMKYEQQRRENERLRKQKEEEAKVLTCSHSYNFVSLG